MSSNKMLENSTKNSDTTQTIAQPNHKVSGIKNTPATFSYFLSPISNTVPYKNITLSDVANAIKGERAKQATQTLRAIEDADRAREFKGNSFDYVTFSGTFTQRKAAELIAYSGLIALDFDHVDVEEVKSKLLTQTDVDTVLLFVSPSGNGIKWIVPSTTKDEHEKVFRMYERYCKDHLNLAIDKSGKDVARACFIPYDEHVVLNNEYAFRKLKGYWHNTQPELPAPTNSAHYEGTSPFDDYNALGNVLLLLEDHGWRIDKQTSNKANTMLTRPGKKSGISASFRLADKVLYVFTDNSVFEASTAYSPSQVFTLLSYGSLTKDNYHKAALQLMDMGYGDKPSSSNSSDSTLSVAKKNGKLNFYADDGEIYPSRLAQFYKQKGFMRIMEEGNDNIIIIKNNNKILKPFNYKSETIAFLKHNINDPEKRHKIENNLVSKRIIVENSWKLVESVEYNLHKDTKDATYFPFKNGVCKVTKTGIEMIDYKSKEIGFFMESESHKHNFQEFELRNREVGQFERFLIYAIIGRELKEDEHLSAKEKEDVRSFYSMIGYLISNYKNPAESPAVILSDEGADHESRKGGRGKTLLTNALQKIRFSNKRGGNEFDTGYRHVFADLEKYHNVYVLDDVPRNFDYNSLYTNITGDITAERKGAHAVIIPFKDAPKFVVTTNWAVRYEKEATSTNRRFVEYKFTDFWNNDDKRPEDYFGNLFFDDWDNKEWQLFYQFFIDCAMQFLATGLKKTSYSKDEDNYQAYFYNDVVLEEFQRVFTVIKTRSSFTVMEFLDEHKNNPLFKYKPIFHHKNLKPRINAYITKHEIDHVFSKSERRWYFKQVEDTASNKGVNDNNDNYDLPF